MRFSHLILLLLLILQTDSSSLQAEDPSAKQLAQWLKRFPAADTDGDGKLTAAEAQAFLRKRQGDSAQHGAPSRFEADPGWKADKFPEHAVSFRTPAEIVAAFDKVKRGNEPSVTSYEKPTDGSLRIVGTGHSFMAPGYTTLPLIARAAGFEQPPLVTHVGGGITGSARYKWEQENGIFQFDGQPNPKLLASIANAKWDAMMWGPYYNDKAEYYSCWIEFCLKYNPEMKFYLSDAWPQLGQLEKIPQSEEELTMETFVRMAKEKRQTYGPMVAELNEKYQDRVFVLPTSQAMVLAVDYYLQGKLPGIEGIHTAVGGKEKSLWRDRLGHLGPGLGNLEGYVFFATMYGRSPELIEGAVRFGGSLDFPSPELDRMFRKIAWQAVVTDPLTGINDEDSDGIADDRERSDRP